MDSVVTIVSRIGHGALVWMRTVRGSTTSAWLIGAHGVAPRSLSLASTIRSRVNFTASASNGSPLWNFTPWRSLNSHTVGATSFGSSASAGRILSSWSRSSSVSKMLRARFEAGVSWWFMRVERRRIDALGDHDRVPGRGRAPGRRAKHSDPAASASSPRAFVKTLRA